MRTYEIISYDVWGNPTEGFHVNDAWSTGIFIEISDKDLGQWNSDKIIKKLKKAGYLKKTLRYSSFEVNGDAGYCLYIDYVTQKNGPYPICELRPIDE